VRKPLSICSADGCDLKHYAKGHCRLHFLQRRRGEPIRPLVVKTPPPPRPTAKPARAEPNRDRDRCPRDHLYDSANTYMTPEGYKRCRKCRRDTERAYRDRKRKFKA
jgi:hypothetical protein